jgi:hypothetical protein
MTFPPKAVPESLPGSLRLQVFLPTQRDTMKLSIPVDGRSIEGAYSTSVTPYQMLR